MNNADKQYFDLVRKILKNGVTKMDRTGTGTISIFDHTMKFNMDEGFPLLTSKKMFTKGIIHELIWFLRGDTNIKYLVDNDVHIWDGDAYKKYVSTNIDSIVLSERQKHFKEDGLEFNSGYPNYIHYSQEEFIQKIKTDYEFSKKWGELGPVYGKQWRNWDGYHKSLDESYGFERYIKNTNGIDQISNLINDLKLSPDSRRLMVNAWNVGDLDKMVLPPCHYGFQCYTSEMNLSERVQRWCKSINKNISYGEDMTHENLDKLNFPKRKLSLKVTIRSNDIFLGCPFNIASYALLLHLLSNEVNMSPCDLILSIGDAHLYTNHIEQAKLQLTQETFKLPYIEISKKPIFDISFEDIKILGYKSSHAIRAELSN
jgi:thymidylate synthase